MKPFATSVFAYCSHPQLCSIRRPQQRNVRLEVRSSLEKHSKGRHQDGKMQNLAIAIKAGVITSPAISLDHTEREIRNRTKPTRSLLPHQP